MNAFASHSAAVRARTNKALGNQRNQVLEQASDRKIMTEWAAAVAAEVKQLIIVEGLQSLLSYKQPILIQI